MDWEVDCDVESFFSKYGLGQIDKARSAIAEVLRLVPESSVKRDAYGSVAYARESDRERFAAALRKAGLPEE